jgi:hypothetical protein
MQVHIERKHNRLTVPIDNYKPTSYHSDLFDQKVSPSRKYYAGNIRRYIAIPNSNNHSRIHRYSNDNDHIDNSLAFMEKAARFSERFNNSFPSNVHYSQRIYSNTNQPIRSTYNTQTYSAGSLINDLNFSPGLVDASNYNDVACIYADICPDCLEVYSIPIYLDDEISNIEIQKRRCRPEKLDQIANLTKNHKNTIYNELQTELPFCILREVRNWTNNKPILRSLRMANDRRLYDTHRVSAVQSKGDSFIMLAIREGQTHLNTNQLIAFLSLSSFRFTYACIGIDSGLNPGHQPLEFYLLYIDR